MCVCVCMSVCVCVFFFLICGNSQHCTWKMNHSHMSDSKAYYSQQPFCHEVPFLVFLVDHCTDIYTLIIEQYQLIKTEQQISILL